MIINVHIRSGKNRNITLQKNVMTSKIFQKYNNII